MPGRGSNTVSRDLDALLQVGIVAGTSDQELLERFLAGQGNAGQAAFEEIVRRHGPMVLGVCNRVLADRQAAEDAFQATFLVLALKARSVRKRESLAAWLHGVSARVARRARVSDRRRRETGLSAAGLAGRHGGDPELAELRSILDEELERLPEKYRRPVVLCYLEGQTQTEAARVLGWSKGTVSGRLARAKDLLRGRLARRGLSSTGALLGAYLAPHTASAGVPSALLLPTVRAAAAASLAEMEASLGSGQATALARGILETMSLGRIKAAVPVLLLSLGTAALAAPLLWNVRSTAPFAPRVRILSGPARNPLFPRIVGVGYTPDGKTVVSARRDGFVRMGELASARELRTIDLLDGTAVDQERVVRDFAISADGRLMAAAGAGRDRSRHRLIQGVWIWNLLERRLLRKIEVETLGLYSLAFSPEGASLATGDESGKIQLWDVSSGEELLTLKLGETVIRGIAFSPDGMTLAATSLGSGVQLWDLGGGRALGAVAGGSQPLALSACFSPDGTLLACGAADGEVTIWDRAGGRLRGTARVGSQDSLAIAFAPDSRSLAVCGDADGTITACDTATGRPLWKLDLGPEQAAGGVAYSPDGKTIVTGHGGVLRFLDAATGALQDAR